MSRDREDTACKRCHAYVCEQGEIVYLKTIASTNHVGGLTYTRIITIMLATNAGHAYYVLKITMEYYAVLMRTRCKVNASNEGRSSPFLPFVIAVIRKIDMFPDTFVLKNPYRAAYY